jgi:hypothetical protein
MKGGSLFFDSPAFMGINMIVAFYFKDPKPFYQLPQNYYH